MYVKCHVSSNGFILTFQILAKASPLLKGALVSSKREVLSYLSSTKLPIQSEYSSVNWDSTVRDLLVMAAGHRDLCFAGESEARLEREMLNCWRTPMQLYNFADCKN